MFFWESQESLTILQWVLRAVAAFFWLFFMSKLMGQRLIGRLTLFDFIIAITIGSVSAAALSNSESSLIYALITIGTLSLLNIIIAYLILKSPRLRRVLQGEPYVLVKNGQLLEDTMRKTRMNLDDILMGIRLKKVPNLSDVEFAILEPNGKISIIPKSQFRAVRPQDLKIDTNYEGMPVVIIEDGNILNDNLEENNLTEDWLKEQLHNLGIDDMEVIQAALLDTQGKLYISKK